MQEKLLHFIWQNLLFDTTNLRGVDGEVLQIINRGMINHHAGPDFHNAKILIDKTLWAGNIEIHIRSGDWKLHGHTRDKAYDNTILHVCWEFDHPVFRTDGTKICCLTLKNRTNEHLLQKYVNLMLSDGDIPCGSMLNSIDDLTLALWKERLLIERLEQKTQLINDALQKNKQDWQEVFYKFMARNFGLKINTEPFATLANNLPLKILSKHKHNRQQAEALVFGVAGFLSDEKEDDYYNKLKREYTFLKHKYKLIELERTSWKFLRLMPANFPSIRLAQFAALIHQSNNLFSKIMECQGLKKVEKMLNALPNVYWDTHYLFGETSPRMVKRPGNVHIHNLIINTIVPFKFAYGKHKDDNSLCQNALETLEEISPERNSIITKWAELGIGSKNSSETQALLQLKNEYCNKKLCLECHIGFKLLKIEVLK